METRVEGGPAADRLNTDDSSANQKVDGFIAIVRDAKVELHNRLESLTTLVEFLSVPKMGYCTPLTHACCDKGGLDLFTEIIDTIRPGDDEKLSNLAMLGVARIYSGCVDVRDNDRDLNIFGIIANRIAEGRMSLESTRLAVDCLRLGLCTYDYKYSMIPPAIFHALAAALCRFSDDDYVVESAFNAIYRLYGYTLSVEMVLDAPDLLTTILQIISTGNSHSVIRLAVKIVEMLITLTERSPDLRERLINVDGFMRAMAHCLRFSLGVRIYDVAERIITEVSRGPAAHVDIILKESGAPIPQLIRLLQELDGMGDDDLSMPYLIARAIWGLFARIFKNLLATPRPFLMHVFLGSGVLRHFVTYAASHQGHWLNGERICEKMRTILPPLLDLHPEFRGMAIEAGGCDFVYIAQRRKRKAAQYIFEEEF